MKLLKTSLAFTLIDCWMGKAVPAKWWIGLSEVGLLWSGMEI